MTESMTKASLQEKLRTEYEAFEAVLAAFRSTHQQMLETIEALSDADLATPGRFPWLGDAANRRSHSNAVA